MSGASLSAFRRRAWTFSSSGAPSTSEDVKWHADVSPYERCEEFLGDGVERGVYVVRPETLRLLTSTGYPVEQNVGAARPARRRGADATKGRSGWASDSKRPRNGSTGRPSPC